MANPPRDKKKLKLIAAEYGRFDWGKKWPFINNTGSNLADFEITGNQLRNNMAFIHSHQS